MATRALMSYFRQNATTTDLETAPADLGRHRLVPVAGRACLIRDERTSPGDALPHCKIRPATAYGSPLYESRRIDE